jgi:hypothetical protein
MAYTFWEYFLALESDLEATARFVEMRPENYEVFSIEYARLLLAAASEVDVLCKRLCKVVDPNSTPRNITDYRRAINRAYPQFHTIEVIIPRFELSLHPWRAWVGDNNPSWWASYNKIKHSRDIYYQQANLQNVLDSLAGLFVVVLYLHKAEKINEKLYPYPRLLSLHRGPGYLSLAQDWDLPDFRDRDV